MTSTSIEVKYNCKSEGVAKVSLTISSTNCSPFNINWYKSCSNVLSKKIF